MTLWAMVPVKPFRRGKSRLSSVLTEDERAVLNRWLLENTLDVLNTISEIEHILVVSQDPYALAISRNYEAHTLQESGQMNLNLALTEGAQVVRSYKASSLLILPADLALLDPQDIRALISHRKSPPLVAIAPDRHRDGTNALLLSPVGCIPFSFGPDSFSRHSELARQAGIPLEVFTLPSLGVDVDYPEDLEWATNQLLSKKTEA